MDSDKPEQIPLNKLGIDWIEDRICAETYENRRALREGGWRWRTVPPDPDTGLPSGLIEVPDPTIDQASELTKRADYLVDPTDAWSDYVDVRELPLDVVGIPYWIHKRVDAWNAWNESTGKPVEPGTAGKGVVAKAHAGKEPFLPVRCKAIKKDGQRCWAWSADAANDGHCRSHAPGAALSANMGHNIMLAKVKVMQAMPAMADALEELALGAASEQVRLKAITEMMDRGGVNAQTDVNLIGGGDGQGADPAAIVRERLADMAAKAAGTEAMRTKIEATLGVVQVDENGQDIVDAEVIEEGVK